MALSPEGLDCTKNKEVLNNKRTIYQFKALVVAYLYLFAVHNVQILWGLLVFLWHFVFVQLTVEFAHGCSGPGHWLTITISVMADCICKGKTTLLIAQTSQLFTTLIMQNNLQEGQESQHTIKELPNITHLPDEILLDETLGRIPKSGLWGHSNSFETDGDCDPRPGPWLVSGYWSFAAAGDHSRK